MIKPQIGDIWKYKRPSYRMGEGYKKVTFLLLMEDVVENSCYTCMNLENGEVGDWMLDYGDEFDNWERLA